MHAGFQEQIGTPNTMIWKYGKNKTNKQDKISHEKKPERWARETRITEKD